MNVILVTEQFEQKRKNMETCTIIFVAFASGIVYASFFEWNLHKFIMHRNMSWLRYPYEKHTLTHHRIFKSDDTYHLQDDSHRKTIPMAWWNCVLLIPLATLPSLVPAMVFGHLISIPLSVFVAISLYYATYEYMHWCMHLPLQKRRLVEKMPAVGWIFYRLNGHHLLHHRYMGKNFNVVLPLWDLLFGTLIVRSKIRFNQATGPCVPNVQPV